MLNYQRVKKLANQAHPAGVVRYKSARSLFSEVAQGEVNIYTTQICLPNSEVGGYSPAVDLGWWTCIYIYINVYMYVYIYNTYII